jgi:hypothetical protein
MTRIFHLILTLPYQTKNPHYENPVTWKQRRRVGGGGDVVTGSRIVAAVTGSHTSETVTGSRIAKADICSRTAEAVTGNRSLAVVTCGGYGQPHRGDSYRQPHRSVTTVTDSRTAEAVTASRPVASSFLAASACAGQSSGERG